MQCLSVCCCCCDHLALDCASTTHKPALTYRHPPSFLPTTATDDAAEPRADRAAARRRAALRLNRRRASAATLLGRLLVAGCLPRDADEWLGARLIGLIGDAAHPAAREVARGVARELRRARPSLLPELYLAALKAAWEGVEDAADPEGAMAPFEALAAAVAGMFTGARRLAFRAGR